MSQNHETTIKFAPQGYASFLSFLVAKTRLATITHEGGITSIASTAHPQPASLIKQPEWLALAKMAFIPLVLAFFMAKPVQGLGEATASYALAFFMALMYALPHTRQYMPAKALIFALSLLGLFTLYFYTQHAIVPLLTAANAITWALVFSVANPVAQKMHENYYTQREREVEIWWAQEPFSLLKSALIATASMAAIVPLAYLF